jgi:hypothetical protein
MVNPPPLALRRRADELHAAAQRELQHDPDAAALLLFYAAECGMKSLYMLQNSLKDTSEARGSALAARSFVHDILRLAQALKIPKSVYSPNPSFRVHRNGASIDVSQLHQAWRYGEKIADTQLIFDWLLKIISWVKNSR